MKETVYDVFLESTVEPPNEMKAFLQEIEAVCRKYGLALSHEDECGFFLVKIFDEYEFQRIQNAMKSYTRDVVPGTNITLAPELAGVDCPANGSYCSKCNYCNYCYSYLDEKTKNRMLKMQRDKCSGDENSKVIKEILKPDETYNQYIDEEIRAEGATVWAERVLQEKLMERLIQKEWWSEAAYVLYRLDQICSKAEVPLLTGAYYERIRSWELFKE